MTKIDNLLTMARVGRARWPRKRAPGKRWGYIGAHTGRNLGDDAMFTAFRGLWQETSPERELVTVELPWHERRLARVGLSGPAFFEGALLGGGTLIGPFWESQVRTLMRQGVPLWTLGTGAGSCGFVQPHQLDLSSWKSLLNDFVGVGVRGPLSLDKLRAIGVERAQVVGDLALILAQSAPLPLSQRPQFAFNLALPGASEQNYHEQEKLREVETVLAELTRQGWQVVPFAMNAVDIEPTRAALARAGIANQGVPLLHSIEEFWQTIGPCAFVIAVRLHAAILAACAGVPTLMLGYRDKCLDFMASMNLEAWHLDLESAPEGAILEGARRLSAQAPSLREPVLQRAQHWQTTLRAYSAGIAAPHRSA